MATFIKAGFWEQLCVPCKGYKGWLNLDELIKKLASTVVGPQGPQGVQGEQGQQGNQGEQGVQGETGAALTVLGSYPDLTAFLAGAGGSPGLPGEAWLLESDGSLMIWNTATNAWEDVGDLQGPQGLQGQQGVQGEQGVQGQQGIQGIQGIQGETGSQGVKGDKGDTGAQGAAGNSVTILGSYADLAAFNAGAGSLPGANIGDSWILLSDGSLMTWNGSVWFDAGDIKGPQGDTGATGATGAKGDKGDTGAKGDQGIQGIQGIQGVKGDQGIQGVKGDTGAQGPAGLPGLFAQTADSTPVVNTAVETTIIGPGVGSLTVPANGFSIGDSFTCALDGIVSCGSSATLHIRIKTLAGAILADTGIIDMAAATNKAWIMNLYFTIRTLGGAGTASISSGGLFSYIRNGGTQFEGYVLSTVNNTTFNTTVNNTLVITAQWDPGSTGNSITSKNFTLTKVY